MTGAGKTTLIQSITEQDIASGAPIIFIDGKGEWDLFERLIPAMEAAGRIGDLRVINPMRPDISVNYNPFWSPDGNYEQHVSFIFESFKMEKDFFEGHQRVYLENIARILHYTGNRGGAARKWIFSSVGVHDLRVERWKTSLLAGCSKRC